MMIDYSNNRLEMWPKRREKENFKMIIFSIPMFCIIGVGFFLNSKQMIDGKLIFLLIGTFIHIVFFTYAYFRSAFIINNTIKEIEITEFDIFFKTFSFKVWRLYKYDEKIVNLKLDEFKYSVDEYPLKDTKFKLERECYKIIINDAEFFLLYKYFNDDLLSHIKNK